jgi:squalene cyclase
VKLILTALFTLSVVISSNGNSDLNSTDIRIESAISKASIFLKNDQNKDGSWGSPHQTKGLNIFAPVPGSHRAFRLAVSALCLHALLEHQKNNDDFSNTISSGAEYLLKNLGDLRRASPMAIYNVWSHAFGIQALVSLYNSQFSLSQRDSIRKLIDQQIQKLQKYESIDGGWGYYDFNVQTKQPSGSSISFVNATVLIALKEAESIGIEIPGKMVSKALKAIHRQRLPDHSYLYGEYLKYRPRRGINRPAGSLGRSHACNLALQLWGDKSVTNEIHKLCLDRLFERNGWLDVARKRPIPHESWFAVAGYFFYYGHLYASLCIEQLTTKDKEKYQLKLANVLLPLQEKNGSWWDFPFYNYHEQYGTGMALLSLKFYSNQ